MAGKEGLLRVLTALDGFAAEMKHQEPVDRDDQFDF